MRNVVCIQRRLTHYRLPLFERMRERLASENVRFDLVVGDPMPSELKKNDEGALSWAKHVPCHYFFDGRLCWQDCRQVIKDASLVIITQENKLLFNYLALTVLRPKRVAFWGHGRNFQSSHTEGLRERFKREVSLHVDWWFAYTGLSQKLVTDMGFPPSRITNVENAVDTQTFAEMCRKVTEQDVANFRKSWSLGDGPLAIFVGSLYAEKRLEFLIEAGRQLAQKIPGFRLAIVGDGPQRSLVESATSEQHWLRYVGPQFGAQKAICMRAASVMLNPGLVGLGILDAFVAGLPLVTTNCDLHSPEIDYLVSGVNGVITEDSMDAYLEACLRLLAVEAERRNLGSAANESAARLTIENMANRFCDGIVSALGLTVK